MRQYSLLTLAHLEEAQLMGHLFIQHLGQSSNLWLLRVCGWQKGLRLNYMFLE